MTIAKIVEDQTTKYLKSPDYNYAFNKKTGMFLRWGKTAEDDPDFSPFGPEIADIEITTKCGNGCLECYKSNTDVGENMSLETFRNLFSKLPKTVTQIAFGADATGLSNPDLFQIMEFSRNNGVIPNITIANINDEVAKELARLCGAVAVSNHDKEQCYNSVKKLTDLGMKQVNIHQVIHAHNYGSTLTLIEDSKTDERISKLNAIVLLSLKQKGRGIKHEPLPQDKFKEMVLLALGTGVSIGFDSCGCGKFLESVKDHPMFKKFSMMAEPCESTCFSMYANTKGEFFPCSFMEGEKDWETGINLLTTSDFLKDVWHHPRTLETRTKIIKSRHTCNSCYHYNV